MEKQQIALVRVCGTGQNISSLIKSPLQEPTVVIVDEEAFKPEESVGKTETNLNELNNYNIYGWIYRTYGKVII